MSTPTAAQEIDARCTKCKRVTGHIIMFLVDDEPKRVKCNSCSSEHRYLPAPQEPTTTVKPQVQVRRQKGRRKEVSMTAPKKTAEKATAAKPRRTRKTAPKPTSADIYEELKAGQDLLDPRKYNPKDTFLEHDHIDHKKFGLGIVLKVRGRKIDTHFRDEGPKILIHSP